MAVLIKKSPDLIVIIMIMMIIINLVLRSYCFPVIEILITIWPWKVWVGDQMIMKIMIIMINIAWLVVLSRLLIDDIVLFYLIWCKRRCPWSLEWKAIECELPVEKLPRGLTDTSLSRRVIARFDFAVFSCPVLDLPLWKECGLSSWTAYGCQAEIFAHQISFLAWQT